MIIGFTGTRKGLNRDQLKNLFKYLKNAKDSIIEGHHGDCIGSDKIFHKICLKLNIPVVLHPPANSSKRAFCKNFIREEDQASYIVRNHNIVDSCDILLSVPKGLKEELRSGTWATIRYAIKKKTAVIIFYPNKEIKFL